MTNRDMEILEFLTLSRICTRKQVQELLFENKHQNVPLRRLKRLADDGYVNRKMFKVENTRSVYVYYLDKKPSKKLVEHDLYITDFLVKLIKNNYEIIEFKKNFSLGNIISDGYINVKKNNRTKKILLEVQLSPHDCISKYYNFKEVIINNTNWEVMPLLYVINNQGLNKKLIDMKVIYDNVKIEKVGEIIG
jgi:predicted transcriptional regulator|nr:MAG TPA: Replication-relaxation [Caudoviricetes sp.]DAW52195.1 MAG TPA: Replication-relaxation [Caudoviricetes sp.]